MSSNAIRPKDSVVLLNVLSNYARFAIAIVCTVVLTPIVIRELGSESFGLWTLVLCVSGYLELFDMGLTAAAMRAIAGMATEDGQKKQRVINTLLVAGIAVGPLVLLAGAGASWWLMSDPSRANPSIPLIIGFVSLRVMMIIPLGVLMGALFGEHRIWLVNALRAGSIAAFTIAAIAAISLGGGIFWLGASFALIYTLEYVAYGAAARFLIPWFRFDPGQFDGATLREIFGFAFSHSTANASNVVLMRTDPLIVSSFLSLGAVAFYAVPMRITEQLFALSKQMINVFSPLFAQLHSGGRVDAVRSAYLTCSKFSFGLMVGIVVPAMFYASEALQYWIGDDFANSQGVLIVLLIAAAMRTMQESSASALVMTGKHAFVARTAAMSAAANIALSLILVGPLGIVGVATATLISVAVFGVLITTVAACESYSIKPTEFLFRVLVPVALPAVAQLAAMLLLDRLVEPMHLLDLAVVGAVSVLTFLIAFRYCSLTELERIVVQRWIASARSRIQSLIRIENTRARDEGELSTRIREESYS